MIKYKLRKVAAAFCWLPTLLLLGAVSGPANSAVPNCSSAVTDTDGDGWGFENNRSCKVVSQGGHPKCSANAIVNGKWGFENGQSCLVQTKTTTTTTTTTGGHPACTSAAKNNGNGWGWENNKSCKYSENNTDNNNNYTNDNTDNSSRHPACSSAAKNNGNGWGWENNKSCKYSGNTTDNNNNNNNITNNDDNNNNGSHPQCSVDATDNGNGWGFEQGRSCLWGNRTQNKELDKNGAPPPPVRAAVPGYVNGTPICLTDSSDGNSDGFGYENERTCKVVAGTTATPENPLLNTRWCQPWAEISYGDYVLQNNTWNDSDVWTDDWSQCIEVGGSRGNYVAKWDYNWLRRDQGNEYSVKSYPQVYYGRKTGNTMSGTVEELGLPAHVSRLPNYKIRYKYSETGSAERNVALESFFHTSKDAEEWNKQFEMMVWVGKPNTKTPGKLVTEVRLDGKDWDVYTNPSLGWGYVAFVEKETSNEGWLDWNKFVEWTRNEGPKYGVWRIGNDTWMGAIEIGTETFWGTGTFTLHEFRVAR